QPARTHDPDAHVLVLHRCGVDRVDVDAATEQELLAADPGEAEPFVEPHRAKIAIVYPEPDRPCAKAPRLGVDREHEPGAVALDDECAAQAEPGQLDGSRPRNARRGVDTTQP